MSNDILGWRHGAYATQSYMFFKNAVATTTCSAMLGKCWVHAVLVIDLGSINLKKFTVD
jgi:hypothetical protein